jgi:hypothetical protein
MKAKGESAPLEMQKARPIIVNDTRSLLKRALKPRRSTPLRSNGEAFSMLRIGAD